MLLLLSTVSDEFRSYRDHLRHALERPDVTVKVQDKFIVSGTPTLEMLDDVTGANHPGGASDSLNARGSMTLAATDADSDLHPWQRSSLRHWRPGATLRGSAGARSGNRITAAGDQRGQPRLAEPAGQQEAARGGFGWFDEAE